MALHPEERQRHFPEEAPVAWDPIRRDLEENEDWYRDLVEHSQDLLCVHDLEGRFLSVNPVPARLLGYSVEEMLQKPMRDFVDPQFRSQFDVYLREIERTGESRGLLAVITRSGEQRIWEYHNTLRTEGVETPIVRGIAHDVTERVRAEKALRASNEQLMKTARARGQTLHELTLFRTLLDQSNDAILVTDPETLRFLDSNERAWAELGYSREELLSMTVFDIDPDIASVRTRVDQQLRQTGCAIIERAHRRKDGTTFPVELNLHRVRLDREYDVAVSRDITARKRAEEALRDTHEQLRKTACEQELTLRELKLFRALLDQSNDAIEVVDPESLRFLDVNERACVELGYSREELLSMTVFDIDPNINGDWRAWMRQQMQESEFAIMERVHRRKDGTTFPVEVNTRRVRLDRDYRVGMVRDITERKRSERALRSLHACNESLVRATDEPSLLNQICDLVVNVGGYRMACVGYAEHDERKAIRVAASSGFEAGYLDTLNVTWADEERGRGPTGTAIRTGEVTACRDMTSDPRFAPWREAAIKRGYRSSLALPLKSGEEVLGALTIYATETGVFDAAEQRLLEELSNNLSYGIMALRARAERKQAEETLHESERRYRLLFSEMVVGFALIEPIYDENGKPCDYRYLEVNPAFETHSGLPRNRVLGKTLREVLPTLDPFWFETYGKVATTGESIHLEKYALPLEKWLELVAFRTHQGQVAVTFADITKRKRAEEALRESELRFRTVYERSPVGIALVDPRTGRYLQVNPKYCEIAGRSEEELLHCDVGSITHPDDIAESREYLQQLAEGTLANQELEKRYLRPDGSVRWVSILVARMWGDGETPRWNRSLVRDITERKQSEEALRESEPRQQLALQFGKIGAFELDLKSG